MEEEVWVKAKQRENIEKQENHLGWLKYTGTYWGTAKDKTAQIGWDYIINV